MLHVKATFICSDAVIKLTFVDHAGELVFFNILNVIIIVCMRCIYTSKIYVYFFTVLLILLLTVLHNYD